MKCPHCGVACHENWKLTKIASEGVRTALSYSWYARFQVCPECQRPIIRLCEGMEDTFGDFKLKAEHLSYPRNSLRPIATEVGDPYRQDFKEACAVLGDSPKASAAISRRCLQLLLRDEAKTSAKDLADQIQEVIESKALPSHLAQSVDAVRQVGNFAAHPLKSKDTGLIVEVEAGEAEWLLDSLEGLFDFYIVQPAIIARKRAALNKKLEALGKPGLK
jgi:hypothetical protein